MLQLGINMPHVLPVHVAEPTRPLLGLYLLHQLLQFPIWDPFTAGLVFLSKHLYVWCLAKPEFDISVLNSLGLDGFGWFIVMGAALGAISFFLLLVGLS